MLRYQHWKKLKIFVYCFCSARISSYSYFRERQILGQNTCTETRTVKLKFVLLPEVNGVFEWELGQLLGSLPIYRSFWAIFCPCGWFVRLFRLFEHCFLPSICFENFSLGLRSEFLRNWKAGASVALAMDEQTMFLRPASFFYSENRSKMAALNSSGYKHGFCTFFIKSLTYWRQF